MIFFYSESQYGWPWTKPSFTFKGSCSPIQYCSRFCCGMSGHWNVGDFFLLWKWVQEACDKASSSQWRLHGQLMVFYRQFKAVLNLSRYVLSLKSCRWNTFSTTFFIPKTCPSDHLKEPPPPNDIFKDNRVAVSHQFKVVLNLSIDGHWKLTDVEMSAYYFFLL